MLGGNREKILPELMAKWLARARDECRSVDSRGLLPQLGSAHSDVKIGDIYVEPWASGTSSHPRRSEAALEEIAYELVSHGRRDPEEIRKELSNQSVTPAELKVAAATGHGELRHIVELLHLLGEEAGGEGAVTEEPEGVETHKLKLSQAIMDHHRLLLFGGPAMGKTAALRWIGSRLSTQELDPAPYVSNVCHLVPLYAPLRELNREPGEPRPAFKDWLLSRMTPGGSAEELALTEEVVRTGQVFILLDGLNEIIGARARTEVVEEIFDLFEKWPQCRVVMTSRHIGYRMIEADSGWSEYALLELDENQAVELLERWLAVQRQYAADQADSQSAGSKLVEKLRSDRGGRLLRQPLLLTILAAGQSQGVRLPQRRSRALHSAVIAMAVRLEPPPEQGAELHLMEVNRTVRALAYVGYKLHSSYWDSMVTITELRTLLVEGFIQAGLGAGDARKRAQRVCQIVATSPTLLVEQASDKYGFFQLIFQEYLAGLYLASFVEPGIRQRVVREQLHTQRWSEVIGFAIAAAEPGVAGELLQAVAEHRSRWEEHLGRDAMAAVRYLAELPDVNPEVRDEMILDLAWHCPELGVESLRRDAAQALSQLPREIANVGRVRKAILSLIHTHQGEWRAPLVRALDPSEHRDLLLSRVRCRSARVRAGVAQALAGLPAKDAEVRRALLVAVEDCNYVVRQAALTGLADLVAEDEEIRNAMLGCLTDCHPEVRAAAVTALASVAATDTAIRAALLEHIGDSTNRVREAAVRGLASLVASNEYVKAALFERLEDWDENVCAAAVEALAPLAQEDENLRAAVLGSLRSNRWSARAAAVAALAPLVERDEAIKATLLARLKADLWGFRPAAVKVLTSLAPALVPELESIKASLAPHMESRQKERALTSLNDDQESLLAHLAHQDEQVRQAAVTALSRLVAQDQELRARLISWLRSEGKQVRDAAIFALAPLVSSDEEVRSTLLSLHDDEQVIGAAVTVLATALTEDGSIRAALIDWSNSSSTEVRVATLTALAQLIQDNEEVQAALIDRFSDEDGRVRVAAVEALAPILPKDDKLKATLLEGLEDENETARAATVRTLTSLFPTDEQVVSALREILLDEGEGHDVARAAVAALTPSAIHDERLRATLLARVASEQRVVGAEAVAALAALAPRDPQIRAALVDCLVHDSWDIRAAAVRALAPMATADSEIRDLLFDRLAGEQHSFVNSTTVAAISPLVTSDQSIQSALLNHFAYHYDHEVRAAAVKALAPLAASDENVRSALLNRLTDKSPVVRSEAAIALATAPEEVQSSLIARLHDVTSKVRSAAAKAIGLGCGREGWPTSPVEGLVWSAEVFPWVRRAALEALVVASHLLSAK